MTEDKELANATSYKGNKVSVAGTVTEYNSQLELILSSGDAIKIV